MEGLNHPFKYLSDTYLQGMGKLYNKGVEQKDLSDAVKTYCKLIMFSEG